MLVRASLPNPGAAARGTLLLAALAGAACSDGGPTEPDPDPPTVQSIVVSSPIDTLLAIGRTVRFTAAATDNAGQPIATTISWESTAPGVAAVSGTGDVTAATAGSATIRATSGTITGSLAVRVLDADIDGAEAVLADPFVAHVAAALGTASTAVDAALTACDSGLAEGNLVEADDCLDAIRAAAAAATDPDDRALLAVLLLPTEYAALLLTL